MAYIKQNWSEMQAKEIPVEAKHFEHIEESLANVINKVGEVTTTEVATWYDSTFELDDKKHLMTTIDKLPLKENKAYTVILTDKNDKEFIYELSLVDSEAVNGITGYKMIYFGDLLLDLDNDEGFALIQDGAAVDENCTIKSAPNKTGVLLIGYKKAVVKETHFTTSTQKVIVQDEEYAKAIDDQINRKIEKLQKGQIDELHRHLENQIDKVKAQTTDRLDIVSVDVQELKDKVEEHREVTNTQITDLNTQVIEIIEMLDNTEVENLNALYNKVDLIEDTVESHTVQIADLDAQTKALQEQLGNVKIEGYEELVNQVAAHEESITQIEDQLETTINTVNSINDQVTNIKSQITEHSSKIAQNEATIAAHDISIGGLNETIANAENRITDHDTQLADINTRFETTEIQFNTLEEQVTKTAGDVASVGQQVSNISDALNGQVEQLNELNSQVQNNIAQTEALVGQISEANTNVNRVSSEVEVIQQNYVNITTVEEKDSAILAEAKAYADTKASTSGANIQIITWEETD